MPFTRLAILSLTLAPLVLYGLAGTAAEAPDQIDLAPHRAVYELGLARPDPTGSVVALRGRLVMEFTDVCEGYTLNQRIHTEMTGNEGNDVVSDFTVSSWESRDGRRFRFALKNDVNGRTMEEYAGRAELAGDGASGTATLTKPKEATFDLPVGTVFPTEHLVKLIRGAIAGRTYLPVRVFDGSGIEGLFETGTHVGKPMPPKTASPGTEDPLQGERSWPVRVAYFPLLEHAETPRYEIGFRLFANGISGDLVLDYGDFAMKGVLSRLELLPNPGC